jgi:HAD superfamily hydrolase (TIGR01509 family)
MRRVYFTAATHFGHLFALTNRRRPFPSLEAMDAFLIARWNETGGADDEVYHLGDFAHAGHTALAAVTPIPETLALAAAVHRKARVAVLTNNNLMVKRSLDALFPELRPIFGEDFYVSAEFGARKPEPDVYLACLSRLGTAPNAALFTDDSPRNVAGAERAGLRSRLYRSSAELEQALKREALL